MPVRSRAMRLIFLGGVFQSTVGFAVSSMPTFFSRPLQASPFRLASALRSGRQLAALSTIRAQSGDELPRFDTGIDIVLGTQASNLEEHGAAIVFVPEALANLTVARERRAMGKLWLGDADSPLAPYSDLLARTVLSRNRPEVNPQQELTGFFLTVDLPNEKATRAVAVAVKANLTMFEMLELAGKAASAAMSVHPASIAVIDAGLADSDSTRAFEAAISAVLAACGPMPTEKSGKPLGVHGVKSLSIFSSGLDAALLARIQATAEGTNLCRYLTATSASTLDPLHYRAWVKKFAEIHAWQVTELDEDKLSALGCGAFLAVSQASEAGAAIMRLVYHPKSRTAAASKRPLVLVGKGITFDTGGVNVKGASGMYGMKRDMSGSAAALATMLALTRLDFPRVVECWLAIADNAIGPKAYKPDDVVRAVDGTTIEIVHTDAEGRMVLADTLALASRKHAWRKVKDGNDSQQAGKDMSCAPEAAEWLLAAGEAEPRAPALVIDYATLTGACVGALSKRYAGAFSRPQELGPSLIDAGAASGERLWPFPMDPDFASALKSTVADILQCTVSSEADHILAAVFLSKFVAKDVHWIHLDLAPANKPGGLAHVSTDETGFGVRASLALCLDYWDKVAKEEAAAAP